jgi:hypothetical protein
MATLENAIKVVSELAPQDLEQLHRTVGEMLHGREAEKEKPLMTESEFAEYLAAKGIVTLPQPLSAEELAADDDDWEPIEVTGEPLSQMIIRERR